MDLRRGTTFQYQQCPLPLQQHDRELAVFLLASIQTVLATIAKDHCRKLKRKEEQRRNDEQDTKKEYPECPTCDKTNNPAERCWKGAGAHLKPKNLKLEGTTVADTSTSKEDAKDKQPTSILKNPKN